MAKNRTGHIAEFIEKNIWAYLLLVVLTILIAFILLAYITLWLTEILAFPAWLTGLVVLLILGYVAYGLDIPIISVAVKTLLFMLLIFLLLQGVYTNIYCQFINPGDCIAHWNNSGVWFETK